MKVLGTIPTAFATGDILDPRDLKDAEAYVKSAIDQAFTRRFRKFSVIISLDKSCGTGLTEIDNIELRTFSIKPPVACTLAACYISGSATVSSGGYININLTDSSGSTPSGITNPICRFNGTTTDYSPYPNALSASTEYDLRIEPSAAATFTTTGVWLQLDFMVDRWAANGGIPSWSGFGEIQNNTSLSATPIASAFSSLSSTASSGATNNVAPTACLFVCNNVDTTRSATTLTFPLPRFNSSENTGTAINIGAWSYSAATGPTITWALKDTGGSTLASVTNNMASSTTANSQSTISVSLVSASAAIAQTSASDYSLVCSSNSATVTQKSYCWLWIK